MNKSTTCPMCSAHFDTEEKLTDHKTEEHGMSDEHAGHNHEPKEFKCAACGATFATKEELDQHASQAHGQKM